MNPPTLEELDCDNYDEVFQRVKFQDWITSHHGWLSDVHRHNLWSALKRGKIVAATGGHIRILEKARLTIT